ncbi:MAG TPA: hypothetical protein VH475_12250 [Tepidisphaeraceae bacterium]|jgi:predicted transcriptional regulator
MTKKSYIRMTAGELAQATREYDREMVQTRALPVPSDLKARLDRAMAKGSRPKAQPEKRVSVRIDGALLRRADQAARKHGLTRSQLISSALRQVLRRKSA